MCKIIRHQSRLWTAPLQLRKRVCHMPGKKPVMLALPCETSILPRRPSKNRHTAHRRADSQQTRGCQNRHQTTGHVTGIPVGGVLDYPL